MSLPNVECIFLDVSINFIQWNYFYNAFDEYHKLVLSRKYHYLIGTGLIKYLKVWNMIQELDPYDIYVCPVTKHSYTLNCV